MHFEKKVERKGLKTPQNPDRDGGRPPPQDDVYQQREYISCTRGFRWGVTRRVADICCLFLGQGVTSIFRKFPQARSAVGVRRKKRIFLRRRRNDFRSLRSVNHFGGDERRFSSSDVPPGATKLRWGGGVTLALSNPSHTCPGGVLSFLAVGCKGRALVCVCLTVRQRCLTARQTQALGSQFDDHGRRYCAHLAPLDRYP